MSSERNEQEQQQREGMTEHGAVTRLRQTFPHPWRCHATNMSSIGTATVSALRPGVQVAVAAPTLLEAVERLEAAWEPVEADAAANVSRQLAEARAKLERVAQVAGGDGMSLLSDMAALEAKLAQAEAHQRECEKPLLGALRYAMRADVPMSKVRSAAGGALAAHARLAARQNVPQGGGD